MSEVDLPKAQDVDLNICSDQDGDRKVAKERHDAEEKCKTANEAESSKTNDKKSEKNQNDNRGNDGGKNKVAQGTKDLNSRHGDRNGVSSTATTADKRENGNDNKSTAIKEEKLPKKKKTQKENANGNVKEDCEKKKRKKKKKKKGGNCEDESTKPGREGETSSKDRSDSKSSSDKIESSKTEVLESVQAKEQSENVIKVSGNEMSGEKCKIEEVITSTGDNEKDLRVEVGDKKIDSFIDKNDEEMTEVKDTGEDAIKSEVINAEITPDKNTDTSAASDEQAGTVATSNSGILDTETLSGCVEKPLEVDHSVMTLCTKDTSFITQSPDQALEENGNDESGKDNFLDTIIESDEAATMNAEEKMFGEDKGVKESDVMDFVDNENKNDLIDQNIGQSGNDLDTINGIGVMDNSIMDNGTNMDDIESTISNMTNEQLQQQLQEQQDAMARLQTHAHTEQVKANILTTSLRAKLRRRDQEMKLTKFEHEQQISAVLSHLLYLEGQMQKEQNEVLEVLNEKDDIIRRQKAAIEDLVAKNNRYLQALKETHGYSSDNGLVKPQNHIVQQNGNISIQDHGNKVILRGNKNKNGDKPQISGHKVRFSAMKDRLRRHKSSLELYQHEPLETLKETTIKYGSEENLVLDRKNNLVDRKERCRSLIDYPVSLFDVEEVQSESPDNCFSEDFYTPTICRNDSTSSLVILSDNATRNSKDTSSAYGFNQLSKSRSVPHALPTVAENDVSPTNLKGRPHSLPSVEMLAKDSMSTTATIATSASSSKTSTPPSMNTTSSSPPSESNPFKSFKNVFKRKGSKKKRAAAVTSGKEQTDALKQHFQKYDMT